MEKKFEVEEVENAIRTHISKRKKDEAQRENLGFFEALFTYKDKYASRLDEPNIYYPIMAKLFASISTKEISLSRIEAKILGLEWN